ncbi:MAG: hypothetical protein QNJ90_12195 [Planctomycetota bacterium]|nr:hypothetical protein [Planctomycetota bacterium]
MRVCLIGLLALGAILGFQRDSAADGWMNDTTSAGEYITNVNVGGVAGLVGKLLDFQTTSTGSGYESDGKVGVIWAGSQFMNQALPQPVEADNWMTHQYKCVTDDPVQAGEIHFEIYEQVYFSGMANRLDPSSPGWWWYALNFCYQDSIRVRFFDAESGEWDEFYLEEEVVQEGLDYVGDFTVRAPGAAYGEHGTATPPPTGIGNPTPHSETGSTSSMRWITAESATGGQSPSTNSNGITKGSLNMGDREVGDKAAIEVVWTSYTWASVDNATVPHEEVSITWTFESWTM